MDQGMYRRLLHAKSAVYAMRLAYLYAGSGMKNFVWSVVLAFVLPQSISAQANPTRFLSVSDVSAKVGRGAVFVADVEGDGRRDLIVVGRKSLNYFSGKQPLAAQSIARVLYKATSGSEYFPIQLDSQKAIDLVEIKGGSLFAILNPFSKEKGVVARTKVLNSTGFSVFPVFGSFFNRSGGADFATLLVKSTNDGQGGSVDSTQLIVARNLDRKGRAEFALQRTPTFVSDSDLLLSADLDGDGKKDFIVNQNPAYVYQIRGRNLVNTEQLQLAANYVASDVDGDGRQDLAATVVGSAPSDSSNLLYLKGDAVSPLAYSAQLTLAFEANNLLLASDLDFDGADDFFLTAHQPGSVNTEVVLQTSRGQTFWTGLLNVFRADLVDYDGDGVGDIFLSAQGADGLSSNFVIRGAT